MKIALGVGFYYPDSIGGTEKYVHDLAIYLLQQGIEVAIIAPSFEKYNEENPNYHYTHQDKQNSKYSYEVYRFGVPKELTHQEVTEKVICRGWQNFEKLLTELKPDIFHLHTLTTTLSDKHLKITKEKGIKTLFTAHVPGTICPKGDFIQYPQKVCDGKLQNSTCGYCYAQHRHKDKSIAEVIGTLAKSAFLSNLLKSKIPQLDIVNQKKNTLKELEENTDYIIAVCKWMYDSFLINGIPQSHLKICRQGVSTTYLETINKEEIQEVNKQEQNKRIKIGFIGRLEPIKGLHILLDAYQKALVQNPKLNIELDIVAVKQGYYLDYYTSLQKKIQSLPNINYQENLPSEKVSSFMANLDYLCIPSICLETGPIVAYEAFANKIPIIGANMGGVAELVKDNKTGFLYQFDKIDSLKNVLIEINDTPSKLFILKENIEYPRTTNEVGKEMMAIYESLDVKQ